MDTDHLHYFFLLGCCVFQISYCQGMSDIASPILAVMDNEAHAFICFCGIMKRLEGNFRPDGQLMSIKFQHLKSLLQYSDPEFYSYLVSRGADDLFFCYRWLLLELKREFVFDDALRMLEITWSSLPPDPPETEVELLGPPLETDEPMSCRDEDKSIEACLRDDQEQKAKLRKRHMLRPSKEESSVDRNAVTQEENAGIGDQHKGSEYIPPVTKEKTDLPAPPFERQTSFGEFKYYTAQNEYGFDIEVTGQTPGWVSSKSITCYPRRQSTVESEEDSEERTPLIKTHDSGLSPVSSFPVGLPIWKPGPSPSPTSSVSPTSWPGAHSNSPPKSSSVTSGGEVFPRKPTDTEMNSPLTPTVKTSVLSPSHTPNRSLLSSPILSFARGTLPSGRSSSNNLHSPGNKSPTTNMSTSSKAESISIKPYSLPPPQEFGKGNPFMLFLCLSILLEHRDHIIKNSLDYNELAMHFDRLVRRHNLSRVLQRAKALFADYLQSEVWDSEEGDEVSSESPTTTAYQHSPSSTTYARPIYSPLASPQPSSPNSTYKLATTIPSPTAQVSIS